MARALDIVYAPSFVRRFAKLSPDLQDEVLEKIGLFKHAENHSRLKVHKLKGRLANRFSFSVNYQVRIIFRYQGKSTAELITVGGHEIYQ